MADSSHSIQYIRNMIFAQAQVIPGNYGSKLDYGLRIFSMPPATPLTKSPESITKGTYFSSRASKENTLSTYSAAPTPIINSPQSNYQGMLTYGLG